MSGVALVQGGCVVRVKCLVAVVWCGMRFLFAVTVCSITRCRIVLDMLKFAVFLIFSFIFS